MICIPPCDLKELLVQVLSSWTDYDRGRLLFESSPVVITYHSTSALLKERYSLLFRMAVSERCVKDLLSSLSSVLIGGRADHTWDFKGGRTLTNSGNLLPLPRSVHAFLAHFGLLSVSPGSQLEYKEASMGCQRRRWVNWNDRLGCLVDSVTWAAWSITQVFGMPFPFTVTVSLVTFKIWRGPDALDKYLLYLSGSMSISKMTCGEWSKWSGCRIENLGVVGMFGSKYFLYWRWLCRKFPDTLCDIVVSLAKRRSTRSFGVDGLEVSIVSMIGLSTITVPGGCCVCVMKRVETLVERWGW